MAEQIDNPWKDFERFFSNDSLSKEKHWKNNADHIFEQQLTATKLEETDRLDMNEVQGSLIASILKWEEFVIDQFAFDVKENPTNMSIELPFPETLFDLIAMSIGVADAKETLVGMGQSECVAVVEGSMLSIYNMPVKKN